MYRFEGRLLEQMIIASDSNPHLVARPQTARYLKFAQFILAIQLPAFTSVAGDACRELQPPDDKPQLLAHVQSGGTVEPASKLNGIAIAGPVPGITQSYHMRVHHGSLHQVRQLTAMLDRALARWA
jgi:hypothetical protein